MTQTNSNGQTVMDLQKILSDHAAWLTDPTTGARADLYGANLYGANLRGANLRGASLYGADLCDANLRDANLYVANLRDADLRDADLCGANLRDANLRGTNLCGANLRGANLCGANLRGANLCYAKNIISFGPVGLARRIGYAVMHTGGPRIQLGCFWGTLDKARVAIREKYDENSAYEALVVAACGVLK